MVALAVAGLAVADVVTYTSLRSFLVARTDDSLDAAHLSAEGALHGPGHGPGDGGSTSPPPQGAPDIDRLKRAVPGLFVQVRRADGTIVAGGGAPQFSGAKAAPPPKLPKHIVLGASLGVDRVSYFTVSATKGSGRYRVRASTDPGSGNLILVVATSLNSVDDTLHQLILVELIVTLAVLGGIALLGLWVIRVGLRPLTEIV